MVSFPKSSPSKKSSEVSLPHPYATSKASFISISDPYYLIHHTIRLKQDAKSLHSTRTNNHVNITNLTNHSNHSNHSNQLNQNTAATDDTEYFTIQLTNSKDETTIKQLFLNCLYNQKIGVDCELHRYDQWTALIFKETIPSTEEEWIQLSNLRFQSNIETGLFVAQELCSSVQKFHTNSILHLNLQMENIFLIRRNKKIKTTEEDTTDHVYIRILGFNKGEIQSIRPPLYHHTLKETNSIIENQSSKSFRVSVDYISPQLNRYEQKDSSQLLSSKKEPKFKASEQNQQSSINSSVNSSVNAGMENVLTIQNSLPNSLFLSPEQILNQQTNQCTDIFYLGCILYTIFTGSSPYPKSKGNKEFKEFIQKQTTIQAPHLLNSKIPKFLSDIIMKCLQFNPNQRYQSVDTLTQDLKKCLALLIQNSESLKNTSISNNQISQSFVISNSLLERKSITNAIVNSLKESQENDQARLILISGDSGIGKTYYIESMFTRTDLKLLSEFNETLFFIYGSFPIASVYPYHGFRECLSRIATSILELYPGSLEDFNSILSNHLLELNHIHSLLHFCPALEKILSLKEDIVSSSYLGVDELSTAIESFLISFHELTQKSLVLFLDDLQFCDHNSLIIIRNLLSRANFPLLLICAHDTVDEQHTLYYFPSILKEDRITSRKSTCIDFFALPKEHLYPFALESLQANGIISDDVNNVIDQLYRISKGNILTFTEFVIQLHKDNQIYFDSSGLWKLKNDILKSPLFELQFDHPAALYYHLLSTLDDETKNILKHASCFGNTFQLSNIASFFNLGLYNVEQLLLKCIELGWIRKISEDYYSFTHNAIQQAIYSLMSIEENEQIHTQLGVHLLKLHKSKFSGLEDLHSAIPVLLQLNASPHLLDPSLIQEVIHLNQKAAQKCLQIAATSNALHYATIANSLLPDSPWEECYDIVVSVFYTLADILVEQRSYDRAQFLFETLLKHSKTQEEKLHATSRLLQCLSKNSNYQRGSSVFISLLKEFPQLTFNMPIPSSLPLQNGIATSDLKDEALTRWIQDRLAKLTPQVEAFESPSDIIKYMESKGKECKDKKIKYFIDCLVEGYPHVVFTHQDSLYISSVLVLGDYILNYGLTSTSCSAALCSFAVTFSLLTKDYTSSFIMAKAGLEIARTPKYYDQNYLTVCLYFYGSIAHSHWDVPHCLQIYDEGFTKGQLCGNAWSGYNCFFKFVTMCFTGQNLSDVVSFEVEAIEFFSSSNSQFVCDSLRSVGEIIHSLTDITGKLNFSPKYEIHNFEKMKFGRYCHSFCNSVFCYFSENYEEAYKHLEHYILYEDDAAGGFFEFLHPMFCVLIIAKIFGSGKKQKEHLITMEGYRRFYERLIAQTRVFHKASYYLCSAECLRCKSSQSFLQIVDYYQSAIAHAQATGFYLIEAIASTRLLEYYYECKQPERLIIVLADEAIHVWENMNANAMIHRITTRYLSEYATLQGTQIVSGNSRRKGENEQNVQSLLIDGDSRTLNALANQVTEIVQDQNADRGCFFSIGPNNEIILVSESNGENSVAISEKLTSSSSAFLPIVEESLKTGKPVIINNASELFKNDPYIKENGISKMMCTPVSVQGKPSGIYYLEMISEDSLPFTEENSKKVDLMAKSAILESINANQSLISKFVPIDFLKLLGEESISEGEIRPVEKELTLLYANIRNLTTLTQTMSSEESFLFLKEFMNVLVPQIKRNGGFIDRFIGDNILAIFPNSADNAVLSAFSMIRILRSLNEKLSKKGISIELQIGIGIHHGEAQLGVVELGSSLFTSIISSMISVCSTLERVSYNLGTPILITQQALGTLSKTTTTNKVVRRLGKFIFSGLLKPESVKSIVQSNSSQSDQSISSPSKNILNQLETFELFELYSTNWRSHKHIDNDRLQKLILLFEKKKFDEALQVLKEMPLDPIIRFYAKACITYKRKNLPNGWSGEIKVDQTGSLPNVNINEQSLSPKSSRLLSGGSPRITSEEFQNMKMKIFKLEQKVNLNNKNNKQKKKGVFSFFKRNRRIHIE